MFVAARRDLNFVHHRRRLLRKSFVRIRQQAIQRWSQGLIAGSERRLTGGECLRIGGKNLWWFPSGLRGLNFAGEMRKGKTACHQDGSPTVKRSVGHTSGT